MLTTKTKVILTAIATGVIFGASIIIDGALRQHAEWLTSVALFPLGYLILMSIVVFIGDIPNLFDYAWIVHAIQFSIYGLFFGRYWILMMPRRGITLVITAHLLMVIAYAGAALLWEKSRI